MEKSKYASKRDGFISAINKKLVDIEVPQPDHPGTGSMPAFHETCCQQRHGVTKLPFPGKHSQGDLEPVPEEAACKRQTLSHDLFVRWAGEKRDYCSLFSIMFRLQSFSLEGSEEEGAQGIEQPLLYLSL